MLASITPLGERGRHRRWGVTVAFYLLGSTAGGAALGGTAGLMGLLARRAIHPSAMVALLAVAVAALGALAIDARQTGRVPSIRRQVNEDWLRQYRSWVYGLGFGLQLGVGVATVVTSASIYLVIVVALCAPNVGLAVAIGAAFGVVRALPVLLTARVKTFAQLGRLHQWLASLQPGARRLTLATELVAAVAATSAAALR
jgi:hypothetical protein